MNSIEKLKSIEWHDGLVINIGIKYNKNGFELILGLKLYEDSTESRKRSKRNIYFLHIDNIHITVDTLELKDNVRAGNIGYGYIKEEVNGRYKFYLYLIDGLINFTFSDVRFK